jgi:BAAT / Acyl-CoA thioester hydrolase C terminal
VPPPPAGEDVFINHNGHAYLLATCRYIGPSSQKVGLSAAKAIGRTPCGVCKPPGSTFPKVAAVVGLLPSGVVTFGIGGNPIRFLRSSWSLAGRPIPFVPMRFPPRVLRELISLIVSRRPIEIRVFYDAAMQNAQAVAGATIAVERTRGPLILLSGTDDGLWPSSRLAQIAMERLKAHRHPYPYAHMSYPPGRTP